jgi:hypothetical protein
MSADLEALNAVMGTFDSNRSADWFASNEGMQYQTHQPDQQPPPYMPHAYGSEAHMPPPMPPQQHRYTPLLKTSRLTWRLLSPFADPCAYTTVCMCLTAPCTTAPPAPQ